MAEYRTCKFLLSREAEGLLNQRMWYMTTLRLNKYYNIQLKIQPNLYCFQLQLPTDCQPQKSEQWLDNWFAML